MYRIVKAEELTTNIYLMDVEAPRAARACQPGQFVIVRTDEDGERIPLTICDYITDRQHRVKAGLGMRRSIPARTVEPVTVTSLLFPFWRRRACRKRRKG